MAQKRSALELEGPEPRWEEHANPGRELEHLEPVWEPVPGWEPDRAALDLEDPRWEDPDRQSQIRTTRASRALVDACNGSRKSCVRLEVKRPRTHGDANVL